MLAQQLLVSARESKDENHHAIGNIAAGDTAFWCGQFETASERMALVAETAANKSTVEVSIMHSSLD